MTTETHNKKDGSQRIKGVVQSLGRGSIPREFITIGEDFSSALGRCVLRDEEQRNAIIIYKAQLEMFDLDYEIQDLTDLLNASSAVGGRNREQALEAHVGILRAKGLELKDGKVKKKKNGSIEISKTRGNDNDEADD